MRQENATDVGGRFNLNDFISQQYEYLYMLQRGVWRSNQSSMMQPKYAIHCEI